MRLVAALLMGAFCAVAPAALAEEPMLRVGRDFPEPKKLHDVVPRYPSELVSTPVSSLVFLDCSIGSDGKIFKISILRGAPGFNESAVRAVREWIYAPTIRDGEPVAIQMTIVIGFLVSTPHKELLEGALHDEHEQVRITAATMATEAPYRKHAPKLLAGALADSSVNVRLAAAESLGRIGPKAKDALPALQKALTDLDEGVRNAAREAIGKITG
jgi:TonB family protein